MEENKTTAPVQEPPKKVRRVGTVAFSLLLIAAGVLLLVQQFVPRFDLIGVLRFSPALLILLGIEVLIWGSNPHVKLKFDWLAVVGCAVILCIVGTAAVLPFLWQYYGPEHDSAENSYENQFVDSLYTALNGEPTVKGRIYSTNVLVNMRHYGDNVLQDSDEVIANVSFGSTQYTDAEAFAEDCYKVFAAVQKAGLPIRTYYFYNDYHAANGSDYTSYNLNFLASYADGLTPAELANRVTMQYYSARTETSYDTEEERYAAERRSIVNDLTDEYYATHDDEPSDEWRESAVAEAERMLIAESSASSSTVVTTPESAGE